MLPSRYFVVDEKSPYPVKRRNKGRRDDRGEPAITLLPPDPYFIMDRPEFNRSPSPTVYRTAPPKSAKNKEASSFVILGDTINTPVQSRPGSPSGRVSPFRGHGFKSPTTTRPNSRVGSPSESPKKSQVRGKSEKSKSKASGPRINRDIGLPPKSPMKISTSVKKSNKKTEDTEDKIITSETTSETTDVKEKTDKIENKEDKEIDETSAKTQDSELLTSNDATETGSQTKSQQNKKQKNEDGEEKENSKDEGDKEEEEDKTNEEEKNVAETNEISESKVEGDSSGKGLSTKTSLVPKEKLFPAQPRSKEEMKFKKPPISPRPTNKSGRNETNSQQKHSVIKATTKPPLPPKKVGTKSILKSNETAMEQGKRGSKTKSNIIQTDVGKKIADEGEPKAITSTQNKGDKSVNNEKVEQETKTLNSEVNKISLGDTILNEPKKQTEIIKANEMNESTGEKKIKVGGGGDSEKTSENQNEKLIPCFQPDKCQIAPPTMASPSPIITPTISTPSTTADLASSSMKNSQSIAAAPTTVTPSTLSSVSSTLVLTGNLAKKELEHRSRLKVTSPGGSEVQVENNNTVTESKEPVGIVEKNGSPLGLTSDGKVSAQMVKAASKDSIKWSNKEKLSGEITSATKVIKAEPDMEVLSPNNLRNVPPRMPSPNMAWDEERLPNGDVPNKIEKEGRFRRFLSAIWRFFSFLFCCRCMKIAPCCRKPAESGPPKTSWLSKLNCCKSNNFKGCNNPFKCCMGCCKCNKPKCCEGMKCCRKKSDANQNPKAKSKKQTKSKLCCAKPSCSYRNCCDKMRNQCSNCRDKINNLCRSLFCLNMICCQKLLKKCTCCHKLKCCQKNGLCSCFNPYVKRDPKKLHKKGSHASNNSRDKDQLDLVLVEHTSLMKAAIPVLPICLAVFCLICNLFVPGFGTLFSGILCLCFGKPRFSTKDSPKNRVGSFIVNTIIGIAQLFTVVFCLVGWGWSIWWGVIMYKLSRRQKRIKLAEKNQKEAEGSNVNHNHVDVEQG